MTDRGGTVFKSNVPAVIKEIDRAGKKKATAVAIIARNVIVESFSGPRTGIWYPVPYTLSASYRASAPHERPAKPTSVLSGSVFWAVETTGSEFQSFVGIPARSKNGQDLGFGIALEFKTGKGKRPWLVPGIKDAWPQIQDELAKRWF